MPAMAVIDAITRLLPGALGHEDSAVEDSFSGALLDCPHFTRPEEFEGLRKLGLEKGFLEVVSGVLVRSSYRAEQVLQKNNVGLSGI